ncbi:Crp/Fnr family transcriptional regulator [bacterium]|nr:Crp/Fnr family transcriptional regulator [bacterium]
METYQEAGLIALAEVLLNKISGFFDVDDAVKDTFAEICDDLQEFEAGTIIVPQGGDYGDVYLLERGWVMRSRHMENGARQIVNLVLPGDFVAMNALLFARSDFELSCKTDVSAYRLPSEKLGNALTRNAMLSAALFWVNAHEESLLAERIVSLGRRSARERTAHVLCELMARLEITGVESIEQLMIPVSQEEFSDILGISVVHMNKTLRAFERDGILSFRNSILLIHDKGRLEMEAGFDKGYIQFTRRNDRNSWRPNRLEKG